MHVNIYLYCQGKSSCQDGWGWDPFNQFDLATFVCRSYARTWISNIICHGLFYVQLFEVRGNCSFFDIGIGFHHCLNFLFTMDVNEHETIQHHT